MDPDIHHYFSKIALCLDISDRICKILLTNLETYMQLSSVPQKPTRLTRSMYTNVG